MAHAAIYGDFEYIKPKQSRELLTIRPDGTASYEEIGDNGLESFVASGEATWKINENNVVLVTVTELRKEMKIKGLKLVPGIEDGVIVKPNVIIPIAYDELANAKSFGSHKWRRRT